MTRSSPATETPLLPCPWCGLTPTLTAYNGRYDRESYCVHCKACDLSLDGDATPAEAVARWNSRVIPDAAATPSTPEGLADFARRCRAYLDDCPGDGGHSDAAGSTAYELIEEAIEHCMLPPASGVAQASWQPVETAPFVSAKRYLIVNGSEIPLVGFRYYLEGPWYDEHGHEVVPLAWQELPSYTISSTEGK
jgi:Lar family restriction alleviation protein